MSIVLYVGKPGSGKTACAVKEIVLNRQDIRFYTNIIAKKPKLTPNMIRLRPQMIIKKTVDKVTKKRDGSTETKWKFEFNKEYWMKAKRPLSIAIDEAHDFIDSRRSSSKVNECVNRYTTMARRLLGETDREGDLIYITQLHHQIDRRAREMAHQIRHHVCEWWQACLKCGMNYNQNSDLPEKLKICPNCGGYRWKKHSFKVHVWFFNSIQAYEAFLDFDAQTYYKRTIVHDIELYFPYYDTHQWEDFFDSIYED